MAGRRNTAIPGPHLRPKKLRSRALHGTTGEKGLGRCQGSIRITGAARGRNYSARAGFDVLASKEGPASMGSKVGPAHRLRAIDRSSWGRGLAGAIRGRSKALYIQAVKWAVVNVVEERIEAASARDCPGGGPAEAGRFQASPGHSRQPVLGLRPARVAELPGRMKAMTTSAV